MLIQDGAWQPPLAPKGAEIVNDRHRYLLVYGPKYSGKTFAILEKVCIHLYEVNGANVGIFFRRAEVARQGVWPTLTNFTMDRWQRETGCLTYIQKPTISNDTKRRYFSVMNHKGVTNFCTVATAYRQKEIEQILKNTNYSLIYINEADQFDETIFDAAADQLRMTHMGVLPHQHQLILDCNPPPEGDRHWLYNKFFVPPESGQDVWRRDHHVIPCTMMDNPWADPAMIESLIQRYGNNPRLNARYLQGIWVPSSENSLFEDVFNEEEHVVGKALIGRPQSEWHILQPPRNTYEIIRGWDPGDVNHACVILTRRLHEGIHHYDILDAIVEINKPISISRFTKQVMERSNFWEGVLKRRGAAAVVWRDWADPSAFIHKSTSTSGTQALEILAASQKKIKLRPIMRAPGSVDARVGFISSLLGDGRISISILARPVIDSLIGLRQMGKKIGPKKLKHPFDAFSYAVCAEATTDLMEEADASEEKKVTRSGSFSVRMG